VTECQALDPRKPGRARADFPGNREQNSEISSFLTKFGKTAPKSPMILGCSKKIPYASEQGIFSAEQGIKVPCSAENREISRRPDHPRARAAKVAANYQLAVASHCASCPSSWELTPMAGRAEPRGSPGQSPDQGSDPQAQSRVRQPRRVFATSDKAAAPRCDRLSRSGIRSRADTPRRALERSR